MSDPHVQAAFEAAMAVDGRHQEAEAREYVRELVEAALAVGTAGLRTDRDRLRRVIERYGRHDDDCAVEATDDVTGGELVPEDECDCGFYACLYPSLGLVEWTEEPT